MGDFRYLYVEDEPLNREVMQTMLEEVIGVTELTVFDDSHDFLNRYRALQPAPDFILLDLYVEPHDGTEMLTMLREAELAQDAKILIVSAGIEAKSIPRYQAMGFDGAISKPIDLLTFTDIIADLESGQAVWPQI